MKRSFVKLLPASLAALVLASFAMAPTLMPRLGAAGGGAVGCSRRRRGGGARRQAECAGHGTAS
jgi:hypothetical protein